MWDFQHRCCGEKGSFTCTGCSSVFSEVERLAGDTHTMVANIFSISVVVFIISVALFGTLTITRIVL